MGHGPSARLLSGPVRERETEIALMEHKREEYSLLHHCYPERVNFRKEGGVNGARRAAAPDATVTSPT